MNIIELEEILSEQAREEEEKSDSEDEGISTSIPKKDSDDSKNSKKDSKRDHHVGQCHPISNTSGSNTPEVNICPKESCCYLCSIPTPKENYKL